MQSQESTSDNENVAANDARLSSALRSRTDDSANGFSQRQHPEEHVQPPISTFDNHNEARNNSKEPALDNQNETKNDSGASSALLPKSDSSMSGPIQIPPATSCRPAPLYRRLLCDSWLCEAVALSISTLSLIAIGVVLRVYDQRASPELSHGLTLNAIISVLATASKAFLICAVASAISQLKWAWFQKKNRPLRDLQDFDDASRGPWGSIAILVTRGGWSLVSIGAFITLLATVFDPFIQQLPNYPVRQVPTLSDAAATKQAFILQDSESDLNLISAINAGIWSNSSQFDRSPSCPSGNCTWPTFQSIGWCSKCEDITSSASFIGCNYTIDVNSFDPSDPYQEIPCALALDHGEPVSIPIEALGLFLNQSVNEITFASVADMIWVVNYTEYLSDKRNLSFVGVENPLMVFAHASLQFDGDRPLERGVSGHVDECVLTLCARDYNISVFDGTPSTSILSTSYGAFYGYNYSDHSTIYSSATNNLDDIRMYWLADPGKAQQVNLGSYSTPSSESSMVDLENFAFEFNTMWIEEVYSRIVGNYTVESTWWPNSTAESASSSQHSGLRSGYSSDAIERIANSGLSAIVDNLAASLTKYAVDMSNTTVSGNVSTSDVYVSVRREWFTLPCVLNLAGIIFLVLTIIVSKHQKLSLWKSSVYALLYHGLEKEVLDEQPISKIVSGMEQSARSTAVRLRLSDARERIVLGT